MVTYIAEQTKLYASHDQNNSNFNITETEVRNFMGILLLSGYLTLPEHHHYSQTWAYIWCQTQWVKTDFVKSRNTYILLTISILNREIRWARFLLFTTYWMIVLFNMVYFIHCWVWRSPWCHIIVAIVPRCLSVERQFISATRSGAPVEIMAFLTIWSYTKARKKEATAWYGICYSGQRLGPVKSFSADRGRREKRNKIEQEESIQRN